MAEIPRGEVNTIAKNIFLSLAILSFSLCNSCLYLMFLHWSRTGRCYHEEKYLFVLGNYVPSVGILCTTDSPLLHELSFTPLCSLTLLFSPFFNPNKIIFLFLYCGIKFACLSFFPLYCEMNEMYSTISEDHMCSLKPEPIHRESVNECYSF